MPQLRLIYHCDHNIISRDTEVTTVSITKGDTNRDVIPIKNVTKIGEIKTADESYTLSPEIYNLYNNCIVWAVHNNTSNSGVYRIPATGESYLATVKYTNANSTQYTSENCPRCSGNNWYFTSLREGSSLEQAYGPYLVAQDFLKFLFTVPGTDRLDNSYGSGLITDSGILLFDDNLENNIRSAISLAETKCKERSLEDPNRTEDEILSKVVIDSIEMDEQNQGVFIFLTLVTVGGNQVRLNFKA